MPSISKFVPRKKLLVVEVLIFLFFIFSRLPSLGHDNFNTDVWKWKARSYDFGTGVYNFQPLKTIQKYHPGVTLLWVGSTAIKVTNVLETMYNISPFSVSAIFLMDQIQKTLLVSTIGFFMAVLYWLLKKILGSDLALLSILLINLEPFFVGLTRVFHLEGLLSVLILVCVCSLYIYFTQGYNKKYLVLSAVTGALAVLTKTSSLFVLPFLVFSLLFFDRTTKALWDNRKTKAVLVWLLVFFVTCVLLWPALWYAPAEVFKTLYKGIFVVGIDSDHYQYYFDQYVDNPGYGYYFVVLALRSSILLLPGLLGLSILFKKIPTQTKKFLFYLLSFSVLYFVEMSIPSKKLDRYVIPAMLALVIMSTVFYENVFLMVEKKLLHLVAGSKKFNFSKYLLYFGLTVVGLVPLAVVHPDYFSYYNPYFGGLSKGVHVLEPKWMIGTREIMDYFEKKAKEGKFLPADESSSFEELVSDQRVYSVLTVGFQEKYYTQIWPFFREKNAWAVVQDLSPFAVKTRYFVYPVWDDSGASENRFPLKLVDSIYVRGVKIYTVYERIGPWTE